MIVQSRIGTPAVIVGDAGACDTWRQYAPVDLLILCGIFGNISDEDIQRTITAARYVLAPRGAVVWTRGVFADCDLRPAIRRWFRDAGFDETAYDGEPGGYAVGTATAISPDPHAGLPARLFTFNR
jgi:hypothetical protein